jgi:hypothetical protein
MDLRLYQCVKRAHRIYLGKNDDGQLRPIQHSQAEKFAQLGARFNEHPCGSYSPRRKCFRVPGNVVEPLPLPYQLPRTVPLPQLQHQAGTQRSGPEHISAAEARQALVRLAATGCHSDQFVGRGFDLFRQRAAKAGV